jgi:hypothetical protein
MRKIIMAAIIAIGVAILAAVTATSQLVSGIMIEVPTYDMSISELEWPNGSKKINTAEEVIEIPFHDTVKSINIQEYNQCVEEEKDSNREVSTNLGFLPEQQENDTAKEYYADLQESIYSDSLDICIDFNSGP